LWAEMGMRTRFEPAPELLGRQRERTALDGLLGDLRSGRGRALMLRGEAGVGKSALLDYIAGAAADMQVARAVGAESEMELAFASLHLLCAPLLDGLERLPGPQRDALEVAFGMRAGAAPDRFMVALAVLTLLSEVAEDRPLLLVAAAEPTGDPVLVCRAARPGADGCASAPGDTLGILTEAILAGERDSGAIGQQNAITASNSASHPWRIR
jgi:AAA ATPase domain